MSHTEISAKIFDYPEIQFSFSSQPEINNDFFSYKPIMADSDTGCNVFGVDSSLNNSTFSQSCVSQEEKSHSASIDDNMSDDLDQIPFHGNLPSINALTDLVRSQMSEKGVEFVVDKCLDLEFEDEPKPIMRKMVRKSPYQIKELRKAYRSKPVWSKKFENQLASRLGLLSSQVHKWHFDEKKRNEAKNRS